MMSQRFHLNGVAIGTAALLVAKFGSQESEINAFRISMNQHDSQEALKEIQRQIEEQAKLENNARSAHEHYQYVLGRFIRDATKEETGKESEEGKTKTLIDMCRTVAVVVEKNTNSKLFKQYLGEDRESSVWTAHEKCAEAKDDDLNAADIDSYLDAVLLFQKIDPETEWGWRGANKNVKDLSIKKELIWKADSCTLDNRAPKFDTYNEKECRNRQKIYKVLAPIGMSVYNYYHTKQEDVGPHGRLQKIWTAVDTRLAQDKMIRSKESVLTMSHGWFNKTNDREYKEPFARTVRELRNESYWRAPALLGITKENLGTTTAESLLQGALTGLRELDGVDITGGVDATAQEPPKEQGLNMPGGLRYNALKQIFVEIDKMLDEPKRDTVYLRIHLAEVIGTLDRTSFVKKAVIPHLTELLASSSEKGTLHKFRFIFGHSADFQANAELVQLVTSYDQLEFNIDMNVWSNKQIQSKYDLKNTLTEMAKLHPDVLKRAHIGIGTDGSSLWSKYESSADSVQKQAEEVLKALTLLIEKEDSENNNNKEFSPKNMLNSPMSPEGETKALFDDNKSFDSRNSTTVSVGSHGSKYSDTPHAVLVAAFSGRNILHFM
jgi:hypothetical protein